VTKAATLQASNNDESDCGNRTELCANKFIRTVKFIITTTNVT